MTPDAELDGFSTAGLAADYYYTLACKRGDELRAKDQRIARLEEALKPFTELTPRDSFTAHPPLWTDVQAAQKLLKESQP